MAKPSGLLELAEKAMRQGLIQAGGVGKSSFQAQDCNFPLWVWMMSYWCKKNGCLSLLLIGRLMMVKDPATHAAGL